MSFRAERSVAKNLENIHVNVTEILRFALNDNLLLTYITLLHYMPECYMLQCYKIRFLNFFLFFSLFDVTFYLSLVSC